MSRVVLITGSSSGIGRAIAELLGAAGWKVIAPTHTELDLSDPDRIAKFCAGIPIQPTKKSMLSSMLRASGTIQTQF